MLSGNGISLISLTLMSFSKGPVQCLDFLKLGKGDSMAAKIKHLDEFDVVCQGL